MGRFLEEIGVLRPVQYPLLMDVDGNPVDLSFLVSRWSSHSHTFLEVWGEFCPSLEHIVVLTGLPVFGVYHAVDALDDEGDSMLGCLHDAMARAKYVSNKGTYLSWMTFSVKGEGKIPSSSWRRFLLTGCRTTSSPAPRMMGLTRSCSPWQFCWPKRNWSHWDRNFWALSTIGSTSMVAI